MQWNNIFSAQRLATDWFFYIVSRRAGSLHVYTLYDARCPVGIFLFARHVLVLPSTRTTFTINLDFRSMRAAILFIIDRLHHNFPQFSDATDYLSRRQHCSCPYEHRYFHSSRSEKRARFRERRTATEVGIWIVTTSENNGCAFILIVGQHCCINS